jgi:hypothetical protein
MSEFLGHYSFDVIQFCDDIMQNVQDADVRDVAVNAHSAEDSALKRRRD